MLLIHAAAPQHQCDADCSQHMPYSVSLHILATDTSYAVRIRLAGLQLFSYSVTAPARSSQPCRPLPGRKRMLRPHTMGDIVRLVVRPVDRHQKVGIS